MNRRGLGYHESESLDDEVDRIVADHGGMPKSFSIGYARRPPISFVKAQDTSVEELQKTQEARGNAVASFYKDLFQEDNPAPSTSPEFPICPICEIAIQDPERHHLNSAHLSALANPQAPLRELSIGPSSTGYQYLLRHGWSPYQVEGLGAQGREGSRTPVQVQMKTDKAGIGLESIPVGTPLPPKPISNAVEARKQETLDKRKRKRVYQDVYGDEKLNAYLGI